MARPTNGYRISRGDFYKRGGLENPLLFRLQRRGRWIYYAAYQ